MCENCIKIERKVGQCATTDVARLCRSIKLYTKLVVSESSISLAENYFKCGTACNISTLVHHVHGYKMLPQIFF